MFIIPFASLTAVEIKQIAKEKLETNLSDWQKNIWQFVLDWFNASIENIAVETSGSTGKPKTILHRKEWMRNSARMTCEALQLQENFTALLCLPANKISGMMMLVRSMEQRMNLICIVPTANPFSKLSDDVVIDFAAFTPMQFMETTSAYALLKRAEKIKTIILGGEGISKELLTSIHSMSNSIYATFGMTETISHIALKKLTGASPEKYFRLLPQISIATNEDICLVVHAPSLGHRNLVTNDVVKIISENEFEWLGRIDNVINSGGVKLYPEEIEALLYNEMTIPFFITATEDATTGQRPVFVIERKEISKEELLQFISYKNTLKKIIQPRELWLAPNFIYTSNEKLLRKETLERVVQRIKL